MKRKLTLSSLLLLALFFALAATALASTTWYVDGVHGSNANNCKAPGSACKTIGHAIALASSGDSIMVAAATYTENLTIGISLNVLGAGASTTILDGGGAGTVVTIHNTGTSVILSRMTVRNGQATDGGGVYNSGNLTITSTTISGNGASCAIPLNQHSAAGGGIANGGTLTIYNSTVSGNRASCLRGARGGGAAVSGGGISNGGTLTIKSSTINGNSTVASAFLIATACSATRSASVAAFTTVAP